MDGIQTVTHKIRDSPNSPNKIPLDFIGNQNWLILVDQKKDIPVIILSGIDKKRLQKEDKEHERSGLKSLRYAKIFDVDIDPAYNGVWEVLPNGDKISDILINFSICFLFSRILFSISSLVLFSTLNENIPVIASKPNTINENIAV